MAKAAQTTQPTLMLTANIAWSMELSEICEFIHDCISTKPIKDTSLESERKSNPLGCVMEDDLVYVLLESLSALQLKELESYMQRLVTGYFSSIDPAEMDRVELYDVLWSASHDTKECRAVTKEMTEWLQGRAAEWYVGPGYAEWFKKTESVRQKREAEDLASMTKRLKKLGFKVIPKDAKIVKAKKA